ncbi:MAG: glycosyltransferase family 4 protein [Terriglobales bacterium]
MSSLRVDGFHKPPTIAYLTNLFPSPLEPYVVEEIRELRKRGIDVVPCSARRIITSGGNCQSLADETLCLQPLQLVPAVQAFWLCMRRLPLLQEFCRWIFATGSEPLGRRLRALLHTWLGAYYAIKLTKRGVQHIHVHHGYFGSWVTMVAARFLNISFSMTLHGSDLLLHAAYLDLKLEHCGFCVTVSEFNRNYILEHHPQVDAGKIIVQRIGVDCRVANLVLPTVVEGPPLVMLAVGRLHPVKDHAFLIRACRLLKDRGQRFGCLIAGEGEERPSLERLIHDLQLEPEVTLLGHLSQPKLDLRYRSADLVVLTSRSEGIPLVLMEAMARGKPVLAPAITGIPELVIDGRTGFLYQPGSQEDFATKVELIGSTKSGLGPLCRAARQHVRHHFDRHKNLEAFCEFFISHLRAPTVHASTEP